MQQRLWPTMAGMLCVAGSVAAPAAPAAVPPAASAKHFVDRLYGNARPPVPEGRTYTPALDALITRAARLAARTDDPDLVGNALCDCQEMEGMRIRVTVMSATPTAAAVRADLAGHVNGPQHVLVKLARVGAEWRVADTVMQSGGSYAAYLREALAGK